MERFALAAFIKSARKLIVKSAMTIDVAGWMQALKDSGQTVLRLHLRINLSQKCQVFGAAVLKRIAAKSASNSRSAPGSSRSWTDGQPAGTCHKATKELAQFRYHLRAIIDAYPMYPKKVPHSARRLASAFSAFARSGPIISWATSASAPRSIQLIVTPGSFVSTKP